MRRSSVVFFVFATLSLVACKKDKDKDGYKGADDCDDADAGIHPGTDEICDGIDNNCDGQVDEGLLLDWYADDDADTYGDPEVVVSACNQPDGYQDNAEDCNDGSDLFHPGASEDDCEDPNDYNCDGSVGYEDADGDGPATKDLKAGAEQHQDDDESWVSADAVSDVAGPVIFVLPTKPPTCLACDANGKVFASALENMVDESPSTAEPHDVRQVFIANRIAGTDTFSFKGHHGK